MNILKELQDDQQLLEGVVMTTSISCPQQINSAQNTQICAEEGYSFTAHNDSFSLTSNNTHQFDFSQYLERGKHHFDHRERVVQEMKGTKKQRGKCLLDVKQATECKPTSKKTWQTILELDSKLFQVHYTGILDRSQSLMNKMNQIVLTEQFCKLKAYERQLLRVIQQIDCSLSEYDKQKKCLLNQISLLKQDNKQLNRTVNQLYAFIGELQQSARNYFQTSLNAYILTNSPSQKIKQSSESIGSVPYARTFSHSVQQINLLKLIELQNKQLSSIPTELFAQFVMDVKNYTERIIYQLPQKSDMLPALAASFSHQSIIRDWVLEISANLTQIQQKMMNRKGVSTQKKINFFHEQSQPKTIQIFLAKLSNSQQHFIRNLITHPHQQLYFLNIVHSAMVTFFGILISQTKDCYLQLSFGDNTKHWIRIFLSELRSLRQESGLSFSSQVGKYLSTFQQFVDSLNQLVIFRMLRGG